MSNGRRTVDGEGIPDKYRLLLVSHQEGRNFAAPFSAEFKTADEKTDILIKQIPFLCD